ncbi:MAG: rod shape-determining protein MreC [Bacteroidales bacterium]|nr:rod shape-determining protein MreC [Bacteroidales bacterium]MDD4421027.1 rod shape-determining protein MreC [Bacteroidales bacterium]
MKIPPLIYNAIGRFVLFVVLETAGVLMIMNNGIVQRYRIFETIRSFQCFFWERNTAIKDYTRLKDINASLIKQNALLLKQNVLYRNCIQNSIAEGSFQGKIHNIDRNASSGTDSTTIRLDSSMVMYDYQLAKVIKNSLNTEHNYLIIDKGAKDGMSEDMGVITPIGVVGITRAVGADYTYVLSFLNNKQTISAKIGRSNIFGTLRWDHKSIYYAQLTEIPQHIKVRRGDTVFTSGYSTFYPANIPIGTAVSYRVVNGTHKQIKVRLMQNFKDLDYVIVVKHRHRHQIDSLSKFQPSYSKR